MAEQFQDLRQLQKQHRNNQGKKHGGKPRHNGGNKPNFTGKSLTGKNITRFPVYLRNNADHTEIRVCRHFEEVQQLLQRGGTWECLGPAPLDVSQTLVSVDAEVQYTVTRDYGVFRIMEINGNVIRLFPTGQLKASTTWMEKFRPRVGAWVIRQNLNSVASRDSYMVLPEKAFGYSFAKFMDPAVLEEINIQYTQVMELLQEKRDEERQQAEEKAALAEQARADIAREEQAADAVETGDGVEQVPGDVEVTAIEEEVDGPDSEADASEQPPVEEETAAVEEPVADEEPEGQPRAEV